MYLASLEWYRQWVRAALAGEEHPKEAGPLVRTTIRGAWGEQLLSLPVEGGRRRARFTPYPQLRLSEHDDWRHSHFQAITSAYGSLPYFQYLAPYFAEIYASGEKNLALFCGRLHETVLRLASLPRLIEFLKANPRSIRPPADAARFAPHISIIELLFARGPETIFYLL